MGRLDLTVYTDDFEQQSIEARHRLDDVSSSLPPAAPELWRTLRQTVFGLLDGSPIPEPIPTPIVADQRVVVPATTLIVRHLFRGLPASRTSMRWPRTFDLMGYSYRRVLLGRRTGFVTIWPLIRQKRNRQRSRHARVHNRSQMSFWP